MVLTEEEAFWVFVALVENTMPIDYYQQLVGARSDQQIVQYLIETKFPRLSEHFQEHFYDVSTTSLQWFTCLFAYNFNFELVARIWDLIFIIGPKFLFRITLAIFHLLEE